MSSRRRSILPFPLMAALLASTLAAGGMLTEDIRIVGRVVEGGSGLPLEAVQVYAPDINVGTITGRDGRYELRVPRTALSQQGMRLVAALIGHRTAEVRVHRPEAAAGDSVSVTVDFTLDLQAIALDELVVSATGETVGRRRLGSAVARAASPEVQAGRQAPPVQLPNPGYRADRSRPHPVRGGNREQYAYIAENGFRSAEDHPLSTFSIDVDRASYSNVRRFLQREGRLPPVDAVQIEEMVNYFSYAYDRPEGSHPVAVTTEVGGAPWAPDHRLLRVGLASRPIASAEMPPANLVFLLDVSGSMGSADKLPLVQASMRMLVDQMRPVDRVAIVVYAGAAGLVLEPTSGAHKDVILGAIDRLHAGGSTAGGAGLSLAYDVASRNFRPEGNNRVILATDGDFNVGESSDAAMVRLIEERRVSGTFLTVLGFGTGNLHSEKMQSLAQHGNGNYAYIDGLPEARKVLVSEMGGTLLTVAKDVKIQIEFNPERVRAYRLLGYENRLLAAEDFNDDARDAGELGAGHTVTALYEIVPVGVPSHVSPGQVDPLRYSAPDRALSEAPGRRAGGELAFVKVRYKQPAGSESRLLEHPVHDRRQGVSNDFTFAAAVAGFGMLLRESEYSGSLSIAQVLALAEDGLGADEDGYRHGFLELARSYQVLTQRHGWDQRMR